MLSRRTNVYLGETEFLVKNFMKCEQDKFNKETNTNGYVNLGTAVNALVEDLMQERLTKGDLFEHKTEWQHYYGLNGSPDITATAAQFLTERVTRGQVTISPSNLRLVNGVSAGLEVMSFILADPGEVILTPVPTYARFFADMNERMKTEVVGVHLEEKDGLQFVLSGKLLEDAIISQGKLGKKVRAFLYCNPNNPTGAVYSKELTMELMKVCAKYQIHFISDEIYALSHFAPEREEEPFHSVLSFSPEELPDPERTHFMWGFSKDFGLAGFRMGFIHSYNSSLLASIDGGSIFTCVPAHMQNVAAGLLKDSTWLDTVYFPTNMARLNSSYQYAVERLSQLNIKVYPSKGALFVWADFSHHLSAPTRESEMELFNKLFEEQKLYIVPGSEFGCVQYGWFRLVYAVTRDTLETALDRITEALGSSAE